MKVIRITLLEQINDKVYTVEKSLDFKAYENTNFEKGDLVVSIIDELENELIHRQN